MSSLEGFPKNPTPEEIIGGLRKFSLISSSNRTRSRSESEVQEGIKTGLWLLRHLPVSRDSVFDYISSFYQDFVQKYLNALDVRKSKLDDKHFN